MKQLVRNAGILAAILLFLGTIQTVSAQENTDKKTKKIRIKTVRIVNGVKEVVDTTFEVQNMSELKDIEWLNEDELENVEISDFDFGGAHKMVFMSENGDVDVMHMKMDSLHKKVMKRVEIQMDSLNKQMKVMVFHTDGGDSLHLNGEHNAFFISDGNHSGHKVMKRIKRTDDGEEIEIEIIGDGKHFVWIDGDSTEHKIVRKHKVMHGNDDNVIIIENKGDSKRKIRRIIIEEEDENGNIVKREIKVNNEKSKKIIIINGDDAEHFEHKMDGDKKVQKKMHLKVMLDNPTAKELKMLKLTAPTKDGELKLEKVMINRDDKTNDIKLSFELANKTKTVVQIFNVKGKEISEDVYKKFSGKYSTTLTSTKAKKQIFYLHVMQNDKYTILKLVVE